jgi:hypothetical protein
MSAYLSLRSLHHGDEGSFMNTLKQARIDVVKNIGLLSIESTKSVYPALVKLQFFNEIDNAWKEKVIKKGKTSQETQDLYEGNALLKNNFELFEPVLALRGVLLQILEKSQHLPSHLLSVTRLARKVC